MAPELCLHEERAATWAGQALTTASHKNGPQVMDQRGPQMRRVGGGLG